MCASEPLLCQNSVRIIIMVYLIEIPSAIIALS